MRLKSWLSGLLVVLGVGCASVSPPQRYGMVVRLKPDRAERYKELHANPWKGVMEQIDRSHIRNFSIWTAELKPGEHYLFAYFEYTGDDFEADMAKMGEDAQTQRWWKETDPCQEPIETAEPGELWVMMEEVFFHDLGRPEGRLMPAPVRIEAGKAE